MGVLMRQLVALVVGSCAVLLAGNAGATTIYVNSDVDQVKNNGNCTLREAIKAANTNTKVDACPAGTVMDTIDVPVGYFALNSSQVDITSDTTISGAGYPMTTIDLTGEASLLVFGSGVRAVLQSLTLADAGVVALEDSLVSVDHARIWDALNWTWVSPGGSLVLTNSEVVGCFSTLGPIVNEGYLTIRNSTLRDNAGYVAGAILNTGSLEITDSTIAHNQAYGLEQETGPDLPYGASAILAYDGAAVIYGSTIVDNASANMGGNRCDAHNCGALTADGGFLGVATSVVARNTTAFVGQDYDCADFDSPISSGGYNLLGSSASSGCPKTATDLTPQDPGLMGGFLPEYYGGVGFGYLPKTNSPLLGAIPASNSLCNGKDQRYVKRGRGGGCEPGAMERANALFVVDNPNALNAGDAATKASIEQLGFTTTLADDDTVTAAAANAVHLVVISESVTSTKINTKLKAATADVLLMEPSLFDDMGMTGTVEGTDFSSLANQTVVKFRANSRAARDLGFAGAGAVNLFATTSNQSFGWGVPGASATVHATTFDNAPTHATFFEYALNATLKDGTAAKGHRVGFFAFPGAVAAFTTSSANNHRDSGKGLLLQAILNAASH